MLKLKIIIASTRPGRLGLPIGNWFYSFAKATEKFEVELLDLAVINLPFFDEPNHPRFKTYTKQHTKDWSAMIENADALVIVTPEYNYGFPATIKNALDYLNQEWKYKPMSFVSYSIGTVGGTRAVQLLKPIIAALGMVAIPQAVPIPFADKSLDEKGSYVPNEITEKNAHLMIDALAAWAKHLKEVRKELLK